MEYKIIKNLGVITEKNNGWRKEINIVSWNGRQPKVDIREWSEDHSKMSKGIVLTDEEAETLTMALHNYISERSK